MKNYELVIGDEVIELRDELTLGQYQELNKNPERYKNPLQLLSLLTGISVMELKNQDRETIELLESVMGSRFSLPDVNELILTFTYEGVEYGLEKDWSKLAFGAWVDFEVYSSENIYENLHRIMAILYRPIVSKDKKDPKKYKIVPYKSEEIEERGEIMRFVPVTYWLSSAVFFLTFVKIYTTNIESSLTSTKMAHQKVMKGLKKLPQRLQKILQVDSISPFYTNSQRKILQKLGK
jgi:hypothetical protein